MKLQKFRFIIVLSNAKAPIFFQKNTFDMLIINKIYALSFHFNLQSYIGVYFIPKILVARFLKKFQIKPQKWRKNILNSHHVNFNEVICRNLVFLANMYTDSTHVLEGCYGLLKMSCLAVYFLLNAARYISYLWVLDNFAFCAVWQKCM